MSLFAPRLNVSKHLKTDRAAIVSDIRTIKHQYDPDERVIKITLELTAQEIREIDLAIQNYVKHMRRSEWVYPELKSVQRLFTKALIKLMS